MRRMLIPVLLVILALTGSTLTHAANSLPQTPLKGQRPPLSYPRITIYTVSWCPHCKALKEYLTKREIPFINRDVEVDESAMKELTDRYKSFGVPVIVIGNDEEVLKGFTEEALSKAIERHRK